MKKASSGMGRTVIVVSLGSLLFAACKQAPTEPLTPTPLTATLTPAPLPTATPHPAPQIAGSWGGTLDGLCLFDPYRPQVTAMFQQQGTLVTGRISDGSPGRCSITGDFTGTLNGETLSGAVGSTAMGGSATESELVLRVSSPTLQGTLTLRR